MANTIAIATLDNASVADTYALDADTASDIAGICHEGADLFWIILASGVRPLKLYRLDRNSRVARRVSNIAFSAPLDSYTSITTDGASLYIYGMRAVGSPATSTPQILVVNKTNPSQTITRETVGTGLINQSRGISFYRAKLLFTRFASAVPSLNNLLSTFTNDIPNANIEISAWNANLDIEHDGADRLWYISGSGGKDLGHSYIRDANVISNRTMNTPLTGHTGICMFGPFLAIAGF